MLPYVCRVTKYDPADRDAQGSYIGREEAVSDHGPVEAAYLHAVAAFAEDAGVDRLAIREPQIAPGFVDFGAEPASEGHGLAGLFPDDLAGYHDGAEVPLALGLELLRAMLRDNGLWCSLEVEGRFAVHVGWDQYVYVSSSEPCDRAVARTRALGLFPEDIDASPYDVPVDREPTEQRPADDTFWARVRRQVVAGQAALLEENYLVNATRWHRLREDSFDGLRARLTPRAQLAVWPEVFTDVATALAALPEDDLVECLREDAEGRITSIVTGESGFADLRKWVAGARAAAVLSLYVEERHPLFTAVLPDPDGVLRARWRTETTPGDRDWALLKSLRRGQVCGGTVSRIDGSGVVFVDIGGFTATLGPSELPSCPAGTPSGLLVVGQEITAEILDVDPVGEQVALCLVLPSGGGAPRAWTPAQASAPPKRAR